MSCEVAALPFQAHAYYGTWSIDFVRTGLKVELEIVLDDFIEVR